VGAEFIVAAKVIVASTLASLFSTFTFFSDFLFNIHQIQSILNKDIYKIGTLKKVSNLIDTLKKL
jgi:hypothetical protein